jgi:uncharacterized protein (DUF924 family)
MSNDPDDVLNFWFMEVGPTRWFKPDPALDEKVRGKFQDLYDQAVQSQLKAWENTPTGMLALILLFSVFPRRMYRGTARAYAMDDMALELARAGIIRHFDDRIDRQFKLFFYLPFGYAENRADQRLAVYYIRERTKEHNWIDMAEERQQVIQCFGRFPDRNAALGRETSAEEAEYLKQAGGEA